MIIKEKKYILIFILSIVIATVCYALGTVDSGYRINPGEELTISANGICRKITNNSANSFFIPTKTISEWNSFISNSSLIIGMCSCNLPWGGTIDNGQSVTAYLNSNPACNVNCESETRTCADGVLTGSYANQNCTFTSCCVPSTWCSGGIVYGNDCVTTTILQTCGPCGCTPWGGPSCRPTALAYDGPTGQCTSSWLAGCGGSMGGECVYGTTFLCGGNPCSPPSLGNIEHKYTCGCAWPWMPIQ